MTDLDQQQPKAPLEFRRAPDLNVRYADRIIELVAVPYDSETAVMHQGRMVVESIAAGSFDGVERRANRVKVNRDHDITRTCGRAVALYPSRTEGLVAELKIGRSPLGDETLEYAADGILDASVGFAPFPGHEHWLDNRSRRRITRAFLGHIAMVPDPAYQGAQVLAVRSADVAPVAMASTPNLDTVRLWQLQDRFGF